MADREKVINGLREMSCRETWKDIDRIRHKFQPIINDAISLLKEQEPRVMTLEEVKSFGWDYCYLEEERLPRKEYRMFCGDHALTCITWPCVTSMRIQHGDNNYGKKWRCWTSKPTNEQRKAVKWDD